MERRVHACRHERPGRTLIWYQRYLLYALRESGHDGTFRIGMGWGAGDLMDLTSGIAWAILIVVATVLGSAASWFSLRTLRWFTCVTAVLVAIVVTVGTVGMTTTVPASRRPPGTGPRKPAPGTGCIPS